jgi:hypothetical protein
MTEESKNTIQNERLTELQVAATLMRRHWYDCFAKWPPPYFCRCSPGYSHPKCEEGIKLENEYMRLIREQIKKDADVTSPRS